ncbi:MAG: D-alanyl-D-alanine carboxypeptidase/D-alanyl-D-alanine-endopeptidase [bacterium]
MAQRRGQIFGVVVTLVLAAVIAVVAFAATRAARGTAAPRPVVTSAPVPPPSVVPGSTQAPSGPTTSTTAGVPRPAAVAAAFGPALTAPALGGSVHALVVDASTGTALLNRTSTAMSPPASTAKLATAGAVLAAVPATARLTTRVVAGARPGEVVLVGGGDPTLSAARAGAATMYPGAARITDLAAQITADGIAPVTSVVVDGSVFAGAVTAPGWAPEDVPSDYAAAITGLVVDGARPAAGGDERSATPDLEAGRALAIALRRPDATVSRGVAPAGAAPLATVRSAPVLDLVEQMLSGSDNVMAEMLARHLAAVSGQPPTFAGAVAAIRSTLAAHGITVPATLVDASGLSARDRLSPAVLVALLRAALTGTDPRLRQVVSALPVAGWDGTLATRYRVGTGAAAAGAVRAKSGTLTGVLTLAGLTRTKAGRPVIFAVMADRVPADGRFPAEAAVDRAIARLVTCACT